MNYLPSVHGPFDFLNSDHGYTTAGGVTLQRVILVNSIKVRSCGFNACLIILSSPYSTINPPSYCAGISRHS
jgi:hypothetical protein